MFIRSINDLELHQFVHEPTRISDAGKRHILDLLVTNTFDGIFDKNMMSPFSTVDHCTVPFQVNCPKTNVFHRNYDGEVYNDYQNANYDMTERF